nr:MAG: endonuclease V [Bacteroidota bacterium]
MGPDPGPGGPFGLAGTWPRSPAEAVLWQEALAARIQPEGDPGPVCYVAGCDVAYRGEWAYGVVLLFEYATGRLLSHSWARERARFPYVPGLLSFREVPVLLEAFFRLEGPEPDLVLCDGQGIAHPRRMGLAAHLGLCLDRPSIGVAKSRLWGEHDPLPEQALSACPLRDRGEVIGYVLRTRARGRPIYISPGHRIGPEAALRYVLTLLDGHRLPYPTRLADRFARTRLSQEEGR